MTYKFHFKITQIARVVNIEDNFIKYINDKMLPDTEIQTLIIL